MPLVFAVIDVPHPMHLIFNHPVFTQLSENVLWCAMLAWKTCDKHQFLNVPWQMRSLLLAAS